jgi:8-oxo-(d)GTP phosphatase
MTHSISPVDPAGIDVLAAGAVLYRPGPDGPQVALVHRPRYDDWSFPKGKLDPDEAMPFAAAREVAEETGHRCRLGALLGDVRYEVAEGSKLVRYWAAEAGGGGFVANHETDELRWLPLDEAAALLSYQHDREVLHRFTEIGPPRSMVLLVRHAKAGSRSQWEGEDALRPLSATGRAQAEHLDELLALFGPDRLYTAPPRRCRDTIGPLAARLGVDMGVEPRLGEEGYWANPPAALSRLTKLAAQPGVTVISGQGGVIPDLVAMLVVGRSIPGVDPDNVPARKASTWALGFGPDGLRSADYYREPKGGMGAATGG